MTVVPGTPPVANPDSLSVNKNQTGSVAVLANDIGVDASAIVSILTQPNHGTATVKPDRTILYVPKSNWSGSDVFSYQVTNPDGQKTTATVSAIVPATATGGKGGCNFSGTSPAEMVSLGLAVMALLRRRVRKG